MGLLERKFEVYSVSAGGRSQKMKWSYRRTQLGTEAMVLMGASHAA
jgi:hypothetical protein